ncbi:MAG: PfkB family carbohydrate kinase [Thauera propionica]|jgi:hydroxymethylpyrimidine/phosphomethylpyrimidine kinase|uniref:Hydroxymethylpyrimidine/phosphomethylpyrimidine kinase n=1 Tax=Thauera propionica TaxID=2019431 RepID=A0A235F0H0_9RHOO|nr:MULTISPECIES: PfkB family carbohydrate kinase [Thauera]MDD3674831.1 PfkB family carbohydrate kinase [Thauera propionica]MDI3490689.1 hydroxymethylpyrimidine/phosphomethylpyrimidine kinase [Thauera sp.]MDY0048215.1 PfkB family carbohydrate kinase [Thauera propionica]OYD54796.1 hydroxymethylpyrimidine/phosphomethylpyrimidine kinase [Thauera propionica]
MPIEIPEMPPAVLCLGAGDVTAGGGIVADVLTLSSMGCHPLAVQTAAIARDTRAVEEAWAQSPEVIVAQARAVLEDIPVAAFKLGFAGSVENIAAIAEILSDYPELPLVVEPALYSANDTAEGGEEMASALADLILPQTTLLVVGRHELCRLAGMTGAAEDDGADGDEGDEPGVDDALERVLSCGTEFILLTDGAAHGPQVVNTLVAQDGVLRTDAWPRLAERYLGAGTTLAAAVAAALAHGMAVAEAVREAQEFTQQTLRHAYRPGMGVALPDRFFWARGKGAEDE